MGVTGQRVLLVDIESGYVILDSYCCTLYLSTNYDRESRKIDHVKLCLA